MKRVAVDRDNISERYFIDCPKCNSETEIERDEITTGEALCINCDHVFELKGHFEGLSTEKAMAFLMISAMDDSRYEWQVRTCPFCNGKPVITHIGNDSTRLKRVAIQCSDCGVRIINSADTPNFKWLDNVTIEQWNERA